LGILYFSTDVECGGGAAVPRPFTDPASGRSYRARIALMLLVEPGSYKVSNGYLYFSPDVECVVGAAVPRPFTDLGRSYLARIAVMLLVRSQVPTR
jgi:hypothetical protein